MRAELGRALDAGALGFELRKPLLKLRSHAVEGSRELCEFVTPANRDSLVEVSARNRIRCVREAPQRADDRSTEQVRDDRKEHE